MGIWERPPQHLPGSAAGRVRLRPAARARATTPSTRSGRCATARAHVFIGLGGNFVQAAPDTEVTMRRAAPGAADRAGLDQDQPLAPGLRRDRADPADPGPDREGRPGQRPAVRLGGGLDLLGARLARGRCRRRARTCAPRSPSSPDLAEATLGDRYGIDWRAMRDDYRVIRRHIARVVPGCEGYEVKVDRPGGFVLPHPPRDSRTFPTAVRAGRVHRVADRAAGGAAGPAGAADPAQPRPVQHHDLRPERPLPRHRGRPPGGLRATPTTWPRSGSPTASTVDLVSHWPDDDHERRATGFRIVAYDDPARLRRGVLPGDQSAGAAGLHRRSAATPRPRSR